MNPPLTGADRSELAPPLGLYTLSNVVHAAGAQAQVLDLNLATARDPNLGINEIGTLLTECVARNAPTVVALTSMAVNSHVALELARRMRAENPGTAAILGGPHFGPIASEILTAYDWISAVCCGPGEDVVGALARAAPGSLPRFRGLVTRERESGSSGAAAEWAGPIDPYEGCDLEPYFQLNPHRTVDMEATRGCRYACTFCYSAAHWGRGVRFGDAAKVVRLVRAQAERGVRHVFFVDDNLTNDEDFAVALAESLQRQRLQVSWNCYSTIQGLTTRFLRAASAAGCRSVFVGLDAVLRSTQRRYRKSFFRKWREARGRLAVALDLGIVPTCAFLVEPDDGAGVLSGTLDRALDVRELGCEVRINPIAAYGGTPLAAKREVCRYSELRARLMFDGPRVLVRNDFAMERPQLFPFHRTHGSPQRWDKFVRETHAAITVVRHFPMTLRAASHGTICSWGIVSRVAERTRRSGGLATTATRSAERLAIERIGLRLQGVRRGFSAHDWARLEAAKCRVERAAWQPAAGSSPLADAPHVRIAPHEVVRLSASGRTGGAKVLVACVGDSVHITPLAGGGSAKRPGSRGRKPLGEAILHALRAIGGVEAVEGVPDGLKLADGGRR